MTRQEIIEGFHKLYLQKIAEETAKRGGPRVAGIPVEDLKPVFNEAIADYVEMMLRDRDATVTGAS